MRIVHLGRYYGEQNTGGAAIAATRLHRALIAAGVDSIFVCLENRSSDTERVIEFPPRRTIRRFLVVALSKISRNIWRFTREHRPRSLNLIPTGFLGVVRQLRPDIVHVHWFTDENASFRELRSLNAPLVMHLHDMWMLCAFEPYPHNDRRYLNGYDKQNSRALERFMFNRKLQLARQKAVSFVGPSTWVRDRADSSMVARGHRNFCVPYFQNPIFGFRDELRVPHKKFRVLFGAYGGRSNPIKGFHELSQAIQSLPLFMQNNIEVWIFGEDTIDEMLGVVPVHFLGVARNPETLMGFYHQADVFAFPSREETWGQTKSEALLCGLPVVAFDRTACAEGICHGLTGWIAPDGDIESFAKGLAYYYESFAQGKLKAAYPRIAGIARQIFDNQVVLGKMLTMYKELAKV